MIARCLVVFFLVGVASEQTTSQLVSPETQKTSTSDSKTTVIISETVRPPVFSIHSPSQTDRKTNDTVQSTSIPDVSIENYFTTLPIETEPKTEHSIINNFFTTPSMATSKSTGLSRENIQIEWTNNESDESNKTSTLLEAVKELQEQHSDPNNPEEDFLHFVQSVLRSTSIKRRVSQNHYQKAPELIKKLISIIPNISKKPTLEDGHSNLHSANQAFNISETQYNKDDFVYLKDENDRSYHSNKMRNTLSKNIQQIQKTTFPISSHQNNPRKNSYSLTRMGLAPYIHMEGSHRSYGEEEYKFGFNVEQDALNKIPTVFGSRSPSGFPTQNQRKQMKPYKNYYPQDYQWKSGNRQHSFKYFQQELNTDSPQNSIYLQRRVSTSTPRKSIPDEEYYSMKPKTETRSAKYTFTSDIEDEINGNVQQRQETREGSKVTGSYSYEDGFFRRTVHYVADEKGYRVVREEVDEIGDGPSYNPDGSARFQAYIAGNNVNYKITNKDISGWSNIHHQQPVQNFQSEPRWRH